MARNNLRLREKLRMNTAFQQRLYRRLKGRPRTHSLRQISDNARIRPGCDSFPMGVRNFDKVLAEGQQHGRKQEKRRG